MSDDALTADPSSSEEDLSSAEAVEALLRQLVDARFVLTDRDGAVTRWSGPAEELFGWPATWMLGRPLVKTLGLPDSLPPSGGQLETVVRRKDGQELEVAMALVPVRMSQSLEFNGFLEALEIAAPRGEALSALGRSHRAVVDWIQAALEGNAHLDDEGLAAGTIVAFRPLSEPPDDPAPEDQELHAAREVASAEAAQANERLESELADTRRVLDEMRAEVDSLRGDLEHTHSAREEQARADRERELDEMRTALEGFRSEVAGTPQAQERLHAQLEQTREQVSTLESALAEAPAAERVEEAARALRSELAEAQLSLERVEATGASERARLEGKLADTRKRLERIEGERGDERTQLEAQLAETRGRLEELARAGSELESRAAASEEVARKRERLEAELEITRSRIEGVESSHSQDRDELKAELAGTRERLEELATAQAPNVQRLEAQLAQTQGDLEALRQAVTDGQRDGEESRLGAEVADLRGRIEQVQVEAVGDEEARLLINDLREELGALRSGVQDRSGEEAELRTLAEQAAEEARGSREALASMEAETGRAQELVREMLAAIDERVETAIERASTIEEQAGALAERLTSAEALAGRAESAAKAADAAAALSSDSAGSAAETAARSLEAAGAAEGHADRARVSSGAAEHHAGRAAEHAGDAENHVRRIAEAAAVAERRAAEAQQAAADAADAAELARVSAAEAGSEAQAVRRAGAGPVHGSGYETPVVLTPLDGRDPRAHSGGATQRPLFGRRRNEEPRRELREGFDDAGRPMATVELNGHFRELNRAFSDLVGYSEEEFQAALWPPVMDRANLPKHREQINHLLAGQISSAGFDTGYVHAQGLLVPLTGTITLVKREGNPDHFLLDVQAPG